MSTSGNFLLHLQTSSTAGAATPTSAPQQSNKPSLAGLLIQSGGGAPGQHHNGGGRSGSHHRGGGGGGRTSPSARSSPSYHGGGGSHPNFSSNPTGPYNTHHPAHVGSAHNLFKTTGNTYIDRSPTNRGGNASGYHYGGGATSPVGGSSNRGGGRMSGLARGMSGPPSPSAALSGIMSVAGEPLACTETNMDWTKLNIFRTRLCDRLTQTNSCHMANRCLFSHDLSWPRRTPFLPRATALTLRYIPVWCPGIPWPPLLGICDSMGKISWTSTSSDWDPQNAHNLCIRGDNCPFVHNLEEFLYHPEIYKTTRCCLANDDGADEQVIGNCVALCPWYFCPFAHDTYEQRDMKNLRCGWHHPPQIVDNHFVARTQGFDEVELSIIEFVRKAPGGSLELYRNPNSPLKRLWHNKLPPVFRPFPGSSLERLVPSNAHSHAYFDDLTYFVIIASLQNLLLYPVENFYVPSLLSLQCAVLQYQLNLAPIDSSGNGNKFQMPQQMDCQSLLQEYDRRFAPQEGSKTFNRTAISPISDNPPQQSQLQAQRPSAYNANNRRFLLPNPADASTASPTTNEWKPKQPSTEEIHSRLMPHFAPHQNPAYQENPNNLPSSTPIKSDDPTAFSTSFLPPPPRQSGSSYSNDHMPRFYGNPREDDSASGVLSGPSAFFPESAGYDLSPGGRSADVSSAPTPAGTDPDNIWKLMDFNDQAAAPSSNSAHDETSPTAGGFSPVGEANLQRERADLKHLLQSVTSGDPGLGSGSFNLRDSPDVDSTAEPLQNSRTTPHCSPSLGGEYINYAQSNGGAENVPTRGAPRGALYGNDNPLTNQGFLNAADLGGIGNEEASTPAPTDVDTQQLCASLIQTLNSPNGANFLAALFNLVSTNCPSGSPGNLNAPDLLAFNAAAQASSPCSNYPTMPSTPDNTSEPSASKLIDPTEVLKLSPEQQLDGQRHSLDEPATNFLE